MKTPFEAKRVIVAGCAAIAMVLGAMSVGTSFIHSDDTVGAGEVSAIINSDTPSQHKPAKAADFSRKHTIEVRDLLQQQSSPLYTTNKPAKNSRKSIAPVFSNISPFFLSPINQLPLTNATPSGSSPDDNDPDAISGETEPSKSAGSETPASSEEPAATPPADTNDTDSEEPAANNDAPSPLMRSQTVEQTPTE
jgi:hypothetical protein